MICKEAEPLAGGFCFGEGPRWHDGALWFSDMLGAAVHTVDLTGAVTTLPLPGRAPSGLGFAPDGSLLIVSTEDRQLLRYADGEVSVQDLSAQRAAPLLLGLEGGGDAPLKPGARVLDACAAPGGKTAHLLELADLDVLALDSDPQRLARVQDTLTRLRLQARLQAGDGRQPPAWWDGRPFDAILLDAPCTASGIVRRHPDVRWLRRPDDVAALARTQAELLDALWPLLAPGGRLLYATCSIFQAEGRQQIDAFLQRHAASKPMLAPHSPGHLLGLPDNGPSTAAPSAVGDGFFYALIRKP